MLHQIISMYYPELKNVKLNIFNKFQANSDLNQIKLPNQNLNQKFQDLLRKAKEKCRLINLLYEISRIQFILDQQFGQQVLINSHLLGGKVTKGSTELYCDSNKESNKLSVKPLNQEEENINNFLQDEPLELLLIQV
ncbi:unnamed protein product [Paramecium sonneborni]|uniref:Uncharacterized protein n=1 Tax=Paramecium sonneborni TaxID=65129 RepID=A0A8S1RNE5_9CILI|nr:unnamed protein product [Paramecium sonneborni]